MSAFLPFGALAHLTLAALVLGCGSRTDLLPSGSPPRSECPPSAPGLPVVLAADLSSPTGMAIDDAYVYWAEFGGGNVGRIRRVPICGGSITTLATDPTLIGQNIAVNAAYVYWESGSNPVGSSAPFSIMRIAKTGGTPESVTPSVALSPVTPFAVGATAVYCSVGYQLSLDAIPLDGAPPQVFVPAAGLLGTIAVNSGHLYWAEGTSGAELLEAPLDQAFQGTGTLLAFASLSTVPAQLVTDATTLYWTETGSNGMSAGNVCSVPIAGGAQVVLASGQTNPRGIAVHGGSVFWTNMSDPSSGSVSSVPLDGGPVTVVASGQNFPRAIAADGTYVYRTSSSNNGASDGTIQRMAC